MYPTRAAGLRRSRIPANCGAQEAPDMGLLVGAEPGTSAALGLGFMWAAI